MNFMPRDINFIVNFNNYQRYYHFDKKNNYFFPQRNSITYTTIFVKLKRNTNECECHLL
jgi:hypothetical protein